MKVSQESIQPNKRSKTFCVKTFRKELRESEALKSLKKFIAAAQNEQEDVIMEYMENNGSIVEILSLVDTTARGDLTTALPVFETVHHIFLRFQSSDSKYHQHCLETAKLILSSHMVTVHSLLTMNTSKHKKVALKLLTAIVMLKSSFAYEVLNLFTPTTSMIDDLILPTPEKESVRKYFILFTLSFLIDGSFIVIKTLLDSKGFLSMILPALKYDEATTVTMTLSLLENKILKNLKVTKILKLRTFNTQIIKSLFELFDWKGPQSLKKYFPGQAKKHKVVEIDHTKKALVVDAIHSFLLVLCTSKKYGICFLDKHLGQETIHNQLLLSVFESLSNPLVNDKTSDVVLKTLVACPDIIKPTLLRLEPFFQPRNSKNWMQAMEFAENLIKGVDVIRCIRRETKNSEFKREAKKLSKEFCVPLPLLRTCKSGAEPTQAIEVRLMSLRLLATMWDSVLNVSSAFHISESDFTKSLLNQICKCLPDFEEIVTLWRLTCDNKFLESIPAGVRASNFLIIVKSLQLFFEFHKETSISFLDLAFDLLRSLEEVNDNLKKKEFMDIQSNILKFVEMGICFLKPDTELFKTSLLISLQSTMVTSLSFAHKVLSNLEFFQNRQSEIDIWLLCFVNLSPKYKRLVSSLLVNSIMSATSCHQHKGKTEIDGQTVSFMSHCIDELKKLNSNSKEELSQSEIAFRMYLGSVTLHLQHDSPGDATLFERFKMVRKTLDKSILKYLKCWATNSNLPSKTLGGYLGSHEFELEVWLLNDGDSRSIEDILTNDLQTFNLYLPFKITLGHLIRKLLNDDLNETVAEKFFQALLYFIKPQGNIACEEGPHFVCCNMTNEAGLLRNFVDNIFDNEILLKIFNIFSKAKSKASCLTSIIVNVLMKNECLMKMKKNESMNNWKAKFLKDLKRKLKKRESTKSIHDFDAVLSFFDYTYAEAADMVNLMLNELDLNFFIDDDENSLLTTILTKFIKLQCLEKELNEEIVKKLCFLMKFFDESHCTGLQILDECLVFILRTHPVTLLSIDDEFIEILLKRKEVTREAILLGKLLLNDPKKVNHFLKLEFEKAELALVFSLISSLLVKDDIFLDTVQFVNGLSFWNVKEVSEEKSPDFFECLKKAYDSYHSEIFRALKGENGDVFDENLPLAQCLVRLFAENNVLKVMKKDLRRGNVHLPLTLEMVKKFKIDTYTEMFVQGLLVKHCNILKSSTETSDSVWTQLYDVLCDVIKLDENSQWPTVAKSSEWQDFFKLALGTCFKSAKYATLMKIIRLLTVAFYRSVENSKSDCSFHFQMVISHSQFIKVILDKSDMKEELISLFYVLVERCPGEMSSKHIPILLAAYSASLNPSDQTILKILNLYERNGFKFGDYEPLVWGETAASHYSIGHSNAGLSLWQRFNMTNVLNLLDSQRLEISLKEFPIHRGLEESKGPKIDKDFEIYDPIFILPLFASLLSPGSVVFPLPFIYRGGLAYTVRALSSECCDVRKIASLVLMRFYNHLELSQNLKQKSVWMHFINCFRYGIENIEAEPLPNIFTLFFAKMSLELSGQPSEMRAPLQNFFLAKPYFSFKAIPEFLPLFHSSHVFYLKHRVWLLNIIKDALKTDADVKVVFHTVALKVLFCHFHSTLSDAETKSLILQVIEKLIIAGKVELLISEYGLLSWIRSIDSDSLRGNLLEMLTLLANCSKELIKNINTKKNKRTGISNVINILNILMKMASTINSVRSPGALDIYLKTLSDCLILLIKQKKTERIKSSEHILRSIVNSLAENLNLDIGKFWKISFYFREYESDSKSEIIEYLKRMIFFVHLLGS